ncbi:DUF4140 domain-containing protein [Microdochium nivale]|nr:DUF4140 domain-containing protein [Microdochium nivale]
MGFGSLARPASPPSASGLTPDDDGHAIRYSLRDLPTRSVHLSPSHAHVVRAIDNIQLEPYTTHITIIGLSPTVDEHSIKLDATGPVSITDISVHLLPNRDIFEDIYPDSDDGDDDDDDDDSQSDAASDVAHDAPGSSRRRGTVPKESESIGALREQLADLRDDQQRAAELIASAEVRLRFLDAYGRNITATEPTVCREGERHLPRPEMDISASLETYRVEREKAFRDNMDGKTKGRQIHNSITKLTTQIDHELEEADRARSKAAKLRSKAAITKVKERQRRERKAAEKAKEKTRVRQEREACWPRNVYVVKIILETVMLTPGSTRRNSISSKFAGVDLPLATQASTDDKVIVGLTLSYMTTSAYWSPTYDLSLSTVSNSAVLCFDAMLTNHTSEIWTNCKVSLTTSQAESMNLTEKLPHHFPWHIKIADKDDTTPHEKQPLDSILYSKEEQAQKSSRFFQYHARHVAQSRSSLFGVGPEPPRGGLFGASSDSTSSSHPGGLFGGPPAQKQSPFAPTNNASTVSNQASAFKQLTSTQTVTSSSAKSAASVFGSSSGGLGSSSTGLALFGSKPTAIGRPFGVVNNSMNSTDVDIVEPRANLFGQPPTSASGGSLFGNYSNSQVNVAPASVVSPGSEPPTISTNAIQTGDAPASTALNDTSAPAQSSAAAFGGFGSNGTPSASAGLFGSLSNLSRHPFFSNGNPILLGNNDSNNADEISTSQLPAESLSSENGKYMPFDEDDSSFAQMGLTSNHDLPGVRTLKPTAPTKNGVGGSSRQRVARITSFTDVTFSRTVVAKYKAAAYLRVKICNGSKIPILSGPASITLDGSFLGRMQLPPTSGPGNSTLFGQASGAGRTCMKPGEYMHLDLGMDPSIEVSYMGPLVKTNTGGYGAAGFLLGANKEITRVYTRYITLMNRREHGNEAGHSSDSRRDSVVDKKRTAAGGNGIPSAAAKPVAITVLDQVPTTEDERLRIEVLQPPGLTSEGNKVDIKGSGASSRTSASGNGYRKRKSGSGPRDENGDDDVADDDTLWGEAQARMLPFGKVEWDVTLNPSRMVKLTLEYQCSHPRGESVINA